MELLENLFHHSPSRDFVRALATAAVWQIADLTSLPGTSASAPTRSFPEMGNPATWPGFSSSGYPVGPLANLGECRSQCLTAVLRGECHYFLSAICPTKNGELSCIQ